MSRRLSWSRFKIWRCEKQRCENAKNRYEIIDVEEFSYENQSNLDIILAFLGGFYCPDRKFGGVRKKMRENALKG